MIEFQAVTLGYAGRAVLRDVTFAVPEGELVVVVGPTGSGKSSLLRCLDPELATDPSPTGRYATDRPAIGSSTIGPSATDLFGAAELVGRVLVDGLDLRAPSMTGPARALVAVVRQDPSKSLPAAPVESVVAAAVWARESDPHAGQRQVEEALDLLGLAELRARPVDELSGGQQQRVAIAAAVVAAPRVLVLDEPTSALDPVAAEEVLAVLHRLVHDVGTTVVVAEHRLERVVHHADAVLMVDAGRVTGPHRPAQAMARSSLRPPLVELGVGLGWDPLALSVRDARRAARPLRQSLAEGLAVSPAPRTPPSAAAPSPSASAAPSPSAGDAALVEVRRVSVVRDRVIALRSVSLPVARGEVVAVMGRNGSGKSTLLAAIEGSLHPTSGRAVVAGTVAQAPQDPGLLLSEDTVAAQLAVHDADHRLAAGATAAVLDRLAPDLVGIHPGDRSTGRATAELSEGQRMCLALSLVLAEDTDVLLLDEPTRGLDYPTKARLATILRERARAGCTVLVATHDVELAAEVGTRVVVLAEGEVVADGPATQVLVDSPAFAPQVAKVMQPLPFLRVSDVLAALPPTR